MDHPATTLLRIGDWCVDPASGQISRDGQTARLETRALSLLLCLAEDPGQVVSIDTLLDHAWPGIAVSSDSVYQAIPSLRRVLGDDPKQPAYIATVPRLGYRMVATVSPWVEEPVVPPIAQAQPIAQMVAPMVSLAVPESEATIAATTDAPWLGVHRKALWATGAVICLATAIVFLPRAHTANRRHLESPVVAPAQAQKSIAVLPFSDLTQGMKEGEFADGMTEELIDKLSKLPGLRVPAPTTTFYYRDRSEEHTS